MTFACFFSPLFFSFPFLKKKREKKRNYFFKKAYLNKI